ncbi:uncharacterized membrane protein (DUF485 family) [Virgibacillus natechei]|uniref:Uncharacterized membrane protein (DUF485 family) n=1 Tax=Virgibacillus natechei TaxID=1216297 RepID=A0ABS4IHY3_9BACI|nr:DUF485 domain-containing protein [Virgibacillus natechei]MBP1970562.1 uncharacterized membrane protein (DUF485 family) [Virgibacillus natechei]UZD14038.1 DUF485 domain-containing protein [Virgibacillus natechei]
MENLFHQLMKKRRRLLIKLLTFLIIFYFALPLTLTFFPYQMNRAIPFVGISWGWLYAFAQIPMTWILGWIYYRNAKDFDRFIEQIKQGEQR